MRISYNTLLSLTVTHSFFSDKTFERFELVPDKKTASLFNIFKMIGKRQGNQWSLFFQVAGPFATTIDNLINKELWFNFRITDSSFHSFTNKSYLPGAGQMLFFNSQINSVIIPEARDVYPLIIDYKIYHETYRPVNIRVSSRKGAELKNETVIDYAVKEKQFDLTQYGEDIYNISEDKIPPGDLINDEIFAKEKNEGASFYGVIYFKIMGPNQNTNNQYRIDFASGHLTPNN